MVSLQASSLRYKNRDPNNIINTKHQSSQSILFNPADEFKTSDLVSTHKSSQSILFNPADEFKTSDLVSTHNSPILNKNAKELIHLIKGKAVGRNLTKITVSTKNFPSSPTKRDVFDEIWTLAKQAFNDFPKTASNLDFCTYWIEKCFEAKAKALSDSDGEDDLEKLMIEAAKNEGVFFTTSHPVLFTKMSTMGLILEAKDNTSIQQKYFFSDKESLKLNVAAFEELVQKKFDYKNKIYNIKALQNIIVVLNENNQTVKFGIHRYNNTLNYNNKMTSKIENEIEFVNTQLAIVATATRELRINLNQEVLEQVQQELLSPILRGNNYLIGIVIKSQEENNKILSIIDERKNYLLKLKAEFEFNEISIKSYKDKIDALKKNKIDLENNYLSLSENIELNRSDIMSKIKELNDNIDASNTNSVGSFLTQAEEVLSEKAPSLSINFIESTTQISTKIETLINEKIQPLETVNLEINTIILAINESITLLEEQIKVMLSGEMLKNEDKILSAISGYDQIVNHSKHQNLIEIAQNKLIDTTKKCEDVKNELLNLENNITTIACEVFCSYIKSLNHLAKFGTISTTDKKFKGELFENTGRKYSLIHYFFASYLPKMLVKYGAYFDNKNEFNILNIIINNKQEYSAQLSDPESELYALFGLNKPDIDFTKLLNMLEDMKKHITSPDNEIIISLIKDFEVLKSREKDKTFLVVMEKFFLVGNNNKNYIERCNKVNEKITENIKVINEKLIKSLEESKENFNNIHIVYEYISPSLLENGLKIIDLTKDAGDFFEDMAVFIKNCNILFTEDGINLNTKLIQYMDKLNSYITKCNLMSLNSSTNECIRKILDKSRVDLEKYYNFLNNAYHKIMPVQEHINEIKNIEMTYKNFKVDFVDLPNSLQTAYDELENNSSEVIKIFKLVNQLEKDDAFMEIYKLYMTTLAEQFNTQKELQTNWLSDINKEIDKITKLLKNSQKARDTYNAQLNNENKYLPQINQTEEKSNLKEKTKKLIDLLKSDYEKRICLVDNIKKKLDEGVVKNFQFSIDDVIKTYGKKSLENQQNENLYLSLVNAEDTVENLDEIGSVYDCLLLFLYRLGKDSCDGSVMLGNFSIHPKTTDWIYEGLLPGSIDNFKSYPAAINYLIHGVIDYVKCYKESEAGYDETNKTFKPIENSDKRINLRRKGFQLANLAKYIKNCIDEEILDKLQLENPVTGSLKMVQNFFIPLGRTGRTSSIYLINTIFKLFLSYTTRLDNNKFAIRSSQATISTTFKIVDFECLRTNSKITNDEKIEMDSAISYSNLMQDLMKLKNKLINKDIIDLSDLLNLL